MWYLAEQMRFPNSNAHEVCEAKVIVSGDDLLLIQRLNGTFAMRAHLYDYPFDFQSLAVEIALMCDVRGVFPATWQLAEDFEGAVVEESFMEHDCWDLRPGLRHDEYPLKVGEAKYAKVYPACRLGVTVVRHSIFPVVNIALPMAVFSFLSVFAPLALPQNSAEARFSVSFTLVLTVAAYKFAMASMLPAIAYLTLLDKYVLGCAGVIVLVVLQNGVLSLTNAAGELYFSAVADYATLGAIFAVWLSIHGYYFRRTYKLRRNTRADAPAGGARERTASRATEARKAHKLAKRTLHDRRKSLTGTTMARIELDLAVRDRAETTASDRLP